MVAETHAFVLGLYLKKKNCINKANNLVLDLSDVGRWLNASLIMPYITAKISSLALGCKDLLTTFSVLTRIPKVLDAAYSIQMTCFYTLSRILE